MKRWLAAGLLIAATPIAMLAAQDWNLTFEQTERGHRVGNPDAEVSLIEFVSYTCPHCAHFEAESDAAMRLRYIHEGRATVEIRPVIRNPVDLAASLVADCGKPEDYFTNHRALMLTHDRWMEKARNATPAQMQRWSSGSIASRMRAIGSDLDFHELLEPRGLTRSEVDRCLSNEAKAREIAAAGEADNAEFHIPGTPSFAVNGILLQGVHSWDALQPVLDDPSLAKAEVASDAQ